MVRRILVPLDGSALAESALPCVEQLARLVDASVMLLRVVESEPNVAQDSGSEPAHHRVERVVLDHQEAARSEAQAYVDGVAQRLGHDGLVVQTDVVVGPAAETIIAAGNIPDLIAMATHGRSGIGRWVYGSVADKVLRGATVPVLLVRARAEGEAAPCQIRRILVPLDGSELAEHALPLATMLARAADAEVMLVQGVVVVNTAYIGPYGYGASATVLVEAEEAAGAYLASIAQTLAEQGLTARTAVLYGPAADAILATESEQSADLIVMSTHGHGGLGRWVLGSVADRVLRGAHAPVVLVRAGVPVERVVEPLPVAAAE